MRVWPRTSGSGVTASPLMTTLCDLVGIHDVTIKLDGRRKNVANAVKTFVDAMSSQSLPHDGVEGSGVYMREVFPGRLYWGLQRGVDLP
jgi:small subunit ribosomal protein S5